MNGTLPWYFARSAGLIAWSLLTASVLWGLIMSTKARAFGKRPRPNWMLDLHRYMGGLAALFTGVEQRIGRGDEIGDPRAVLNQRTFLQ